MGQSARWSTTSGTSYNTENNNDKRCYNLQTMENKTDKAESLPERRPTTSP